MIFYETVISFKWQKHTYIECVPVPMEIFDELPAYFRVSLQIYCPSLSHLYSYSSHAIIIGINPRIRNRMVTA